MGFPCGSVGKESTCNAGDLGSIPGLGRSPEERKGYPLQYSVLENSMECIVHEVAKTWTGLSDFHFHFAMMDTPQRTSFVNRCRDGSRSCLGGGIAGSFRSRAISASVENIQLLSRVAQAIHLRTGNVREFLSLHILATVWCYQTRQCLWTGGCEVGCLHVFAFP